MTTQNSSSNDELIDLCASIQLLTGLDDTAWYRKFRNDKGLYGLITQIKEDTAHEARIDEINMALSITGVTLVHGVPMRNLEGQEKVIDPHMLKARLAELSKTPSKENI